MRYMKDSNQTLREGVVIEITKPKVEKPIRAVDRVGTDVQFIGYKIESIPLEDLDYRVLKSVPSSETATSKGDHCIRIKGGGTTSSSTKNGEIIEVLNSYSANVAWNGGRSNRHKQFLKLFKYEIKLPLEV